MNESVRGAGGDVKMMLPGRDPGRPCIAGTCVR